MNLPKSPRLQELEKRLAQEILFLDGAMGTMIQQYKLTEADFKKGFPDHAYDLKGNSDVLNVSRPDVIKEIHLEYLRSGAHIIETNTFNGTWVVQKEYHLESKVRELNLAAAKVARDAINEYAKENP